MPAVASLQDLGEMANNIGRRHEACREEGSASMNESMGERRHGRAGRRGGRTRLLDDDGAVGAAARQPQGELHQKWVDELD